MVKIDVICIGKLKEKYWQDACQEYRKRLGAFCQFSVIELDEYKLRGKESYSKIDEVILNESRKILEKISKTSYVIALCIEGKQMDSLEFSKYLQSCYTNYVSEITFVIGGSWGLSKEIKDRANFRMSMSRMTFPHQMSRVILFEQIYRAFQITINGKYHK